MSSEPREASSATEPATSSRFPVSRGDEAVEGVAPRVALGELGRALLRAWPTGDSAMSLLAAAGWVRDVDLPMSDVTVAEAVALVASHFLGRLDCTSQSNQRLLKEVGRFGLFLDHAGVVRLADVTPDHVASFTELATSPRGRRPSGGTEELHDPSVSTRRTRRDAVRQLFRSARALGLVDTDPARDVMLPRRPERVARRLTDAEIELCRRWAHRTTAETRLPAAFALAEATGTVTELAAVTVTDIDLDEGRVWLHGNVRKRRPRYGCFTAWGMIQIQRRLEVVGDDPQARLITNATASPNSGQVSCTAVLRRILQASGLTADPAVKPLSISAWAGWVVMERTGRIDEVAQALGLRSLDTTADLIGFTW